MKKSNRERIVIFAFMALLAVLNQNCSQSGFQATSVDLSSTDGGLGDGGTPTTTTTSTTLPGSPSTSTTTTTMPAIPNSCALPWGGNIATGQSVTAYLLNSVPYGSTCSPQTRTCTNGTLSGTNQYQTCTVQGPPSASNGIKIDLSYVVSSSSQYQTFMAYVAGGPNGSRGYAFAAADYDYAFKLTGNTQYCTQAIQMADAQVSSAETAIAAGKAPEVAGDSYLDAGGMIIDVALTYDWCSAQLTSAQKTRWANYAGQAISNIWNYNTAKWGGKSFPWSGWGTGDPGDNYYYSFTEATMYWALASGDQSLMNQMQNQIFPTLSNYFVSLPGGGSLEGTGYGTSHMRLFSIYQVWKDSTGQDYGNMNSHMTDSIRYWAHATVPTRDYFAPIGDQARVSLPEMYDYQRRVVLEARHLTTNSAVADLGSWWLNHISIKTMSNGFNTRYDLIPAGSNTSRAPTEPLIYQATGVGQLFARTGWDTSAMWLNFTAGTYNQSHAHQDQGAFTLYDGTWLTTTENIWSHSGIEQGTETNNVVRFEKNGAVVAQGSPTKSSMNIMTSNPATGDVTIAADLTPAYKGNSAVTSWKRNLTFASRKLTVHDTYTVGTGTTATFQLNVPVLPTVNGQEITAGNLHIKIDSPSAATVNIVNWKTVDSSEFSSGYRIDITGAGSEFLVELSGP